MSPRLAEKFGDRVEFHTNPQNLGAPRNFDECVRRARGEWVHILHADDAVMPDFYDVSAAAIAATPRCVMVAGPVVVIDDDGRWLGVSRAITEPSAAVIASWHPCNFAATVVARSAYDAAGPFAAPLGHAADWEMWTRIASLGPVAWIANPHAYYRRHADSDSARMYGTDGYLRDMLAAIEVNVARFPDAATRARVRAAAHVVTSDYALGVAAEQLAAGRRRATIRDAIWGVRLRPNLSTLGRAGDTIMARARGPGAIVRVVYDFKFDTHWRPLLAAMGVTPRAARVVLLEDRFVARFGPWVVRTPYANVREVCVTGPYRWYTAIGARLSFADRGLTFGTTTSGGVCMLFNEPITGLEPFRVIQHPGLTVTVDDPEGFATALRERITP